MKIGIDIRTFVASQITGVGVYTWEILNQLFEKDPYNQYVLFTNQGIGSSLSKVAEFKRYSNVKVMESHYPTKFLNFSINFFKRPYLDKLMGGLDVIWFPNLNFWEASPGVKVLVTVHDLSFIRLPWAFSPKMRMWHKIIKPQKKLERANKIIAVSENTKRDLIELCGLPPTKIQVIYSATKEFDTIADSATVKKKYNLPDNFILFFGTLEPRKNVESLIQAFENITDNCHLVIAGGQGWLYRKIFRLAKKSKKQDLIHFTSYIAPADRPVFYQIAKMLIWPSYYEGFGFPPLEAMKMGCPVITSANSSLPEIAGDAALLIDPYNISQIAWAIRELLTNDDLRGKLIKRGYHQVQKFNWTYTIEKLLETFKSLD